MKNDRHQKIVALLRQFDEQGLTFADAKQKLLAIGCSEAEIEHALFEVPYDGKPNQPVTPDRVTQHFKNNPDAADRVARHMLEDEKHRHKTKILSTFLGSKYRSGRQTDLYHGENAAKKSGYPYLAVLSLISVIGLVVLFTGLPYVIIYIAIAVAALYWVYLFVKNLR